MQIEEQAYQQTQIKMIELANGAALLDLESFIDAINKAETLGPILDPTKYRKAIANLSALKELAIAFRAVQAKREVLIGAVIDTVTRGYTQTPGGVYEDLKHER